jgi:hypothetical protein
MVGEHLHWCEGHEDEGCTVHLPEELGWVACRRHVHPQQASAPAALLVSGACDPAFPHSVRHGACGRGLGLVRGSTRRAMRSPS